MAILLFKLANVPDDEATDIRELLQTHDIYFYETHAGMWQLGVDAIWLTDNTNEEKARELIKSYQAERTANQQQNYAELVEQGQAPTLWQNFCVAPFRFTVLMIAVLLVLAVTLLPFGYFFKK